MWKRCRDGALPIRDLCFHASSLPCSDTFWHAIPTSFYIFNVFYFLFLYFFWCYNLSYSYTQVKEECMSNPTPEFEHHWQFNSGFKNVNVKHNLPARTWWMANLPPFVQLISFTWQLTTVSRELHDHPSVTKAVSRLFFSTAISTAKCSALPTA